MDDLLSDATIDYVLSLERRVKLLEEALNKIAWHGGDIATAKQALIK
jgi:hypothetical protein